MEPNPSAADATTGAAFARLIPEPSPLIVVLSGPSGVGKDAVIDRLRALGRPFHYTVTATTRPPRDGEVDGVDYYFIPSDEAFERLIDDEALLEHAHVYSWHYGVPKEPVREALERGQDVIMRVDVQGVANLQQVIPDAVYIFLAPPSLEALLDRITSRGKDSQESISQRMGKAMGEMQTIDRFDYVIVNYDGRLDDAVAQVDAIVMAEKLRVQPRRVEL